MSDAGFRLGRNSYGKSLVRVMKVFREPGSARQTIRDLSVDISLEGDFDAVHRGDNSKCLPTDTMKNTVYALAKDHPLDSIESFARHLGRHFVSTHAPASSARVAVSEVPWRRGKGDDGAEHPHTFIRGSGERAHCEVIVARAKGQATTVRSGLSGLVVLNSTDSAFSGFARDKFTTLKETRDRIFCTSVTAWWTYRAECDHAAARPLVRSALIDTFARHVSESVQQTLYEMGKSALAACDAAADIRLSLPNKHCLLVDLSPFGMSNENEIFVPTDEPHGLIEATVERG